MKKLSILLVLCLLCILGCKKTTDIPDPVPIPTPNLPTAPSNLKIGVLSKTEVKLSWADNSTNETGFTIQRKSVTNLSDTASIKLPANTTTFLDTKLNTTSTYVYQVSALNTAGSTSTQDTISIIPTMTTLPVSLMSNIVVISGGNVTNGGDSITQRGVVWGTSANPTIDSSKTIDSLGELGMYRSYITTLSPNKTYHIRCYAINPAGIGYGQDITFSTDTSNLKDKCVSYFVFGRTLFDIVNGHNASVIGSVPYSTDGATTDSTSIQMGNGYVTTPPSVYQFTSSSTISLWVKYLSSSTPQTMFSTGDRKSYAVSGYVYFYYGNPTLSIEDTLVNDPNWHNYIITYDSSLSKISFYKDGNLSHISSTSGTYTFNTNNSLSIGANLDGSDKWKGKIDDVVTWNRILTPYEIQYISHH